MVTNFRACRTGNFIAFFKLARKATYLQACLMHAHFSKVLDIHFLIAGLYGDQDRVPFMESLPLLGYLIIMHAYCFVKEVEGL